jgi:hypothetical protein
MADIIVISDSLLRLAAKTRILSTETIAISDAVDKLTAKSVTKGITETVDVSESIARSQTKQRIIEQTTLIEEELKAYKNDIEIVPAVEVPIPSVLLGTRRTRLRRFPRPPRLYDEIHNSAYAELKVLAFSDGQTNRITTGLTLIARPVFVRAQLKLALQPRAIARSSVLLSTAPRQRLTAHRLALSTSIPFHKAKSRLKLKQETQTLESLRPIDAVKVDRLTKLATLALLVDSL